ncbi:hypothetical protein Tco_1193711 [Tanacetum coccineum]
MLFTMLSWKQVNSPYKFKWTEKTVPLAKGIDNDTYSTVDACLNACEMWKAIERSQLATTRNTSKVILNSPPPTYDQEPATVADDYEMSKKKEIDKLVALISLSIKKIYKPTNNNLKTSLNTSRTNQDNSIRINKGTGYDNQRVVNVAGARENIGTQELEANYMYMEQIQKVTPDAADNSGPIFDVEPLQKVQFRRTSLAGFPAQSIRSSNVVALDSPYLLVLISGMSQSRQHESRKSPTKSLFDVGSRRISIVTMNTKEYHSDVLAIITRIMRRTY